MSANPSNPFVLPGFGQSGDAATNPLLASLAMMRQAFAGLSGPAGMSGGIGLSPPLNPEELERKIAELKSVENWLKLNLSMLSSTIQGMEVQLATIATLKSFMAAGSGGVANSQGSDVPAAPPSWFSGWPTAAAQPQPSPPAHADAQPRTQAEPQAEFKAQAAGDEVADRNTTASGEAQKLQGDATIASVAPAAQAWWDMLQQQFGQVAAATAASMAVKPVQAAGSSAAKAPRKATAKTSTNHPTKATAKARPKAKSKISTQAATKPNAE